MVKTVRFLRSYTSIIWAVAAALLFAAAGGPDHLHLCLDGQEVAIALHGPDADMHHVDEGSTHRDEDVNLPETGIAKYFSKSFAQPALLLVAIFLIFWPLAETPRPVRLLSEPLARFARQLLPPLRGPPALNLR